MARLGLQRQAEAEIALEFGRDLGAISDGSPVVRDEHGSFVQGLHRADLAGVKSLHQRRNDAFGFSRERIRLGHRGLLFMLVELRCGHHAGLGGWVLSRSKVGVIRLLWRLRSVMIPSGPKTEKRATTLLASRTG